MFPDENVSIDKILKYMWFEYSIKHEIKNIVELGGMGEYYNHINHEGETDANCKLIPDHLCKSLL